MRFYNQQHDYYCGIDLHARILYVCILDSHGNKVVHQKINANRDELLDLLVPYQDKIVVGVECMHCWYWVSDMCFDYAFDFVLGHALYMKAIRGGKAKSDKIDAFEIAALLRGGNFPIAYVYPKTMRASRDLLRRRNKIIRHGADLKAHVSNTFSQYNLPSHRLQLRYPHAREEVRDRYREFPEPAINRNLDIDLNIVAFYTKELASVEHFIEQNAKQHNPQDYQLLQTIPGIGRILALTILYEIGTIRRFPTVQQFASYSRLVKCKAESAGKVYSTSGNKIGNAHLKWAFSGAAVLYLRGNNKARRYINRLQKRMSKAKALSALAHKLGRCVYFMLRNKTVFDEQRFLPE
ncbi:IS110 family transposase [Vibrio sp. WXL210]|uniref:IS110 family transposase n=1 Tax=Vibrio sp. WXL210 TaxID=3450709 RepID=UPI003EC5F8B3